MTPQSVLRIFLNFLNLCTHPNDEKKNAIMVIKESAVASYFLLHPLANCQLMKARDWKLESIIKQIWVCFVGVNKATNAHKHPGNALLGALTQCGQEYAIAILALSPDHLSLESTLFA